MPVEIVALPRSVCVFQLAFLARTPVQGAVLRGALFLFGTRLLFAHHAQIDDVGHGHAISCGMNPETRPRRPLQGLTAIR